MRTKRSIVRARAANASRTIVASILLLALVGRAGGEETEAVSAAEPSGAWIQRALDARPGVALFLPVGDHRVDAAVVIRADGTTLHGFGRIVQSDPAAPVLRVDGADRVTIRGIGIARAEVVAPSGDAESAGVGGGAVAGEAASLARTEEGIRADDAHFLRIESVRVEECRAPSGAIRLNHCDDARVRDCDVIDYQALTIDDRTESDLYGYAFRCIDGHGIVADSCVSPMILDNRIVETTLLPTRATRDRHGLGGLVPGRRADATPGALGKGVAAKGYARNWHQGSAILVTGPERGAEALVRGNAIRGCGQGIDLHADRVRCLENSIDRAMIGIKAMHGSRNLIVAHNVISRADLWGIMLGPGSASHGAEPAAEGRPARAANVDGGTLVQGNVITDMGRGDQAWNWGDAEAEPADVIAIRIDRAQVPAAPPIRNVLVTGNVVDDSGGDGVIGAGGAGDGEIVREAPRHRRAMLIERESEAEKARSEGRRREPVGVTVEGNRFTPGRDDPAEP